MDEDKKLDNEERLIKPKEASLMKCRGAWILIISGFLLNLVGYGLLWWQIKPTESSVILHYNAFLGIDVIDFELGNRYYELFMVSVAGTFIWLVDALLGLLLLNQVKKFNFDKKDQEASERKLGGFLLLVSGIVVQLGLLVYILAIIRVNT